MADGFSTPKLPFKFLVKRSMAGFYPVYIITVRMMSMTSKLKRWFTKNLKGSFGVEKPSATASKA
jgi:hypothetical protein